MTRRMSPNSRPQRLNFSGLVGMTTIDADTLRQPSENELAGARHQDAPSRRPPRFFMANPRDQNAEAGRVGVVIERNACCQRGREGGRP